MKVRAAILISLLTVVPVRAEDGSPLARVDGDAITASDVEVATRLLGDIDQKDAQANQQGVIDALIELKVVSKAALAEGLDDDPAFRAEMQFLKERALRALYLRKAIERNVTDDAIRTAYDRQVGGLKPVPEVRIRHILVATRMDAMHIIDGVKHGQRAFETEAQKSLDEVTKSNGGDLGFLAEDQIPVEFATAIANARIGDVIAAPVQTPFGYHVLKLESRRSRPVPTLDQATPKIRHALESAAGVEAVSVLKAKASIEVLNARPSPSAAESDTD
ncbi:peptidylprolyl isomerase [Rhizobium sp. BG4]|uniref:peptidylprolyl isomerase n=1 Tax=Rhizobium sp. BG4 TaxID=2613770 RepID=UPI00193CF2B6|nr:peptidylprolyl isomerase [Rhizobium sp. BG4]